MKIFGRLILVLGLLITLIPLSVFGQALEDSIEQPEIPVLEQQEEQIDGLLERQEQKSVSSKIVREEKEKRTSNSKHYLMEDGSYQAKISLGDVHYETEDGQLEDIQIKLVDEADMEEINVPLSQDIDSEVRGLIKDFKMKKVKKNKSESDFRALQVPFDVKLPKKFNKGYSIGKGEDKLTFIPVDAQSVTGSVYGVDTIRYQDAWNEADVTLQLLSDGVKETIILKTEDAPSVFSFEVKGDLTDELTAGGLRLLPAWLIDAEGVKRDVEQTIRSEGNKSYVDLIADVEGLSYPVEIDPTVTISSTGAYDVSVWATYPTSNLGYEQYNYLEYTTSALTGGTDDDKRVYVYYDLSTIPSAAIVINATFKPKLAVNGAAYDTTVYISRVLGAWTEAGITWNNKPSFAPYTHYFTPPRFSTTDPGYYVRNIDVTNLINQIRMNTNYGFVMSINKAPSGQQNRNMFFDSLQGTTKPQLTINYIVPSTAPTVINPNGGEVWDSNHTITWAPATSADITQSNLKYHLQLSTDGGTNWTNVVALTSAGVTSYSYNFSAIAATTQALIRIRAYDGYGYGPWDQSNATFTIKHNTAPNAPTNTAPGSISAATAVANIGPTATLTWTFSDPDVDNTQSAYKVTIYRTSDNVLVKDTNWVNSTMGSYTIPSGVLTSGIAYYWKVQTKDNSGAQSPLSANKYIKINQLPSIVITSYADGQSIPDNLLTFTWTYSDLDSHPQTKYQIQGSNDNWATVAYNSGELASSATTHSSTFAQGEWDFRIRVLDGYEWSAWVNRNNLLLPSSFEPNDTSATAFSILHNQNYTTLISSATDIDFYKFISNRAGVDRITLTVPTGKNYDLYLYDSNMNVLATGAKLTGNEDVLAFAQSGQMYYVKVFGINTDNSPNPYTLQVMNFGSTNGIFHTDYQYDSNGNLTNKQTTTE